LFAAFAAVAALRAGSTVNEALVLKAEAARLQAAQLTHPKDRQTHRFKVYALDYLPRQTRTRKALLGSGCAAFEENARSKRILLVYIGT